MIQKIINKVQICSRSRNSKEIRERKDEGVRVRVSLQMRNNSKQSYDMFRPCLRDSTGMLRIIITTYESVMKTMEV
jgi:hypothetical protein